MIAIVQTLALATPVQEAIVTAAGAVVVALIGAALEYLRRSHKRLGEVKDQVSNAHSTNLRDDIDQVLTELRSLRTEVGHERAERFDYEQRTNDRLTRLESSK